MTAAGQIKEGVDALGVFAANDCVHIPGARIDGGEALRLSARVRPFQEGTVDKEPHAHGEGHEGRTQARARIKEQDAISLVQISEAVEELVGGEKIRSHRERLLRPYAFGDPNGEAFRQAKAAGQCPRCD